MDKFHNSFSIAQFQYIKIQPKTIDLSLRLWGINPTNSVVIPQSLVPRSISLGWILIYWNWSVDTTIQVFNKCLVIGEQVVVTGYHSNIVYNQSLDLLHVMYVKRLGLWREMWILPFTRVQPFGTTQTEKKKNSNTHSKHLVPGLGESLIIRTGMLICCLQLVPLRGDKNFKPHPQNRTLVPLRGSFQSFRRVPLSFLYGNSSGQRVRCVLFSPASCWSYVCEQEGQLLLPEELVLSFNMADAGGTQQTIYFLGNGSRNWVVQKQQDDL